MKIKITLTILLLAGMAVIYSACKKSDTTPTNGPALNESDVSTAVALDINQALFGGYGGLNFAGGLNTAGGLAVKQHTQGRLLHDLSNPFCGLTVDTTLSATATGGKDTTASVSGHISFSFICTNDVLSGFTTNDDLSISISTPALSLAAKINEQLSMNAIDPANDNSDLILKGTLNSSGVYNYKTGTKKSGTRTFNYVLTSLVLDPNGDGDIVSGSATFTTKGTGTLGSWSFTGTIKFLGDHKATITINKKSYTVNLQTGAVV